MHSEELTETTPVARVPLPATTFSCKQHREQAEKFYRDLAAQGMKMRAGMEASGHARWFERLVAEFRFELWIGDAAEIRTMRVRKQKTDRQDAQLILRLMLKDDFPQTLPAFAQPKLTRAWEPTLLWNQFQLLAELWAPFPFTVAHSELWMRVPPKPPKAILKSN